MKIIILRQILITIDMKYYNRSNHYDGENSNFNIEEILFR